MAKVLTLGEVSKDIHEGFARSFQSGNINFLLGTGVLMPAIAATGQIEQEFVRKAAKMETVL